MKFILILLFVLFSFSISANEEENSEVEVIDLFANKSLDQIVLDNFINEEEIEETNKNNNDNGVVEKNEIKVKQIEIVKDNFIHNNEIKDLKNYFDNIKRINSKTLEKEIIETLENIQLNLEIDKHKEILFIIVNYLQSIGQINKSYQIIETYDLSDDKNFKYYTRLKLNYLLSTFQLNEACNFKEEINNNINLDFFFLEKLDIFCLILNDNLSEASLLNTILIESESNLDNYYQYLFSLISNSSDEIAINNEISNFEINKSISKIFEEQGEQYFRKIEEKICIKLLSQNNCVISLGGGSIINRNIRKEIKQNSYSIFLQVKLNNLLKRLKTSKKRPLLNNKLDNKEILKNLLEDRRNFYERADFIVNNNNDKFQVLEKIKSKLNQYE